MRHIIIDIKSGDELELFGKDLYLTDAPADMLKHATMHVETMKDGTCAEEHFCAFIQDNGFRIHPVASLDDLEVYVASNENF